MAKINEDWLLIDTDAYSVISSSAQGGVVIPAIIELAELEVTKRVQFTPEHLVNDDIELDDDGYYKSIVLRQFSTYYCLSRLMLSYMGAGGADNGDVYATKYETYLMCANGLLPEITGDTVNNDGSEAVEETYGTFYLSQ